MKKFWTALLIVGQWSCEKDKSLPSNLTSNELVWEHVFGHADTIRDLSQSVDYVWAATQNNGLMQINKHNFELNYLNRSNSGLPNFTTCILVDFDGILWLGTEHEGLLKLDTSHPNSPVRFDTSNSILASNSITCLFQDEEKNIWIGSKNGLNIYSENMLTEYPDSRFKNLRIQQIGIQNSVIYVGTYRSGLFVHSNGSWDQLTSANSKLADNQIRRLYFESDGRIWLSSYEKYYQVKEREWHVYDENNSGISSRFVNDMLKHSTSRMMFATHHGLSVLKEGRWTNYFSDSIPLPNNIVERLMEDEFGGIWVGTFGGLALVHY